MALFCAIGSAEAQINLGEITKAVTDQVGKAAGTSTTALSETNLVGTWKYSGPAIILESNNTLAQIGGKAVASTASSKVAKELQKLGIKAGAVSFTFSSDKKFTASTSGKKKISGTWTCTEKQITLKVVGLSAIKVNSQMSGGKLQMVMNSTLLLKLASAAGTKVNNSTIKTLSTLASSYDGMQVGMEFAK